ncbi:helix-turn-helix domain-containing protein [Chromobacterium sphagni]
MGLALQQVQNGERAIADIAASSGYASASRFSARFRQRYGLTPMELRRTC